MFSKGGRVTSLAGQGRCVEDGPLLTRGLRLKVVFVPCSMFRLDAQVGRGVCRRRVGKWQVPSRRCTHPLFLFCCYGRAERSCAIAIVVAIVEDSSMD